MNERNGRGSVSQALEISILHDDHSPQWRPARPLEEPKHLPNEMGEVFFIEVGEFVARWYPVNSPTR